MVKKALKYCFTFFLIFSCLNTSTAQTKPAKIWASVHYNKKEVMVGEPLVVTFTVYTSTWFTQPPEFGEIQVPKSLMVKLEQRTGSMMKTIGKKMYPAIEQKFVIYPIQIGENMLPSISIVTECPPEGDYKGKKRTIKSPERMFNVLPPPDGIEAEKWLTAYNVQLSETWSKPLENLKTGDVLERRITIRAGGALAALIPPLNQRKVDFGTIYPKKPIMGNVQNKASFSGRRTEIYTYLIEKAGDFEIPEITYSWFDLRSKKINSKSIEAIKISVAENPNLEFLMSQQDSLRALLAAQEVVEEVEEPFEFMGLNWWQLLIVILTGIGFIWLIIKGVVRLMNRREEKLARLAVSEEKYFEDFHQMIKKGDRKGIMRSLMFWFDRFRKGKYDPVFENFIDEQNDAKLKKETETLDKSIFGNLENKENWSADSFYQDVSKARKNSLKKQQEIEDLKNELPSLNP